MVGFFFSPLGVWVKVMDWREKIWNSDAGRARPEEARRIIEEAGGSVEGLSLPPGLESESPGLLDPSGPVVGG